MHRIKLIIPKQTFLQSFNIQLVSLTNFTTKPLLEVDTSFNQSEKPYFELDPGLIQRKQVGGIIVRQKTNIENVPKIFTPIKIRGQEFHNRIVVSPMCMYSCEKQDGVFTDFHLAHYGNLCLRGSALVFTEATAVEPQGRLSLQDTGLWNQAQADSLARIVSLAHASGAKFGIQLAHGGRKSGCYPPYYNFEESGGKLTRANTGIVPNDKGGFGEELVAPSAIPWSEGFPTPKELSRGEVHDLVEKFASAAERSVAAGVDVIEIHAAHGYLIHEFLSGYTNKRTDEYGGSLENRCRFLLEIISAVRSVIPNDMPLLCRVSGTDSAVDGGILAHDPVGWDIYQVIELCRAAVPLGLDVIDISSAGNLPSSPASVVKGTKQMSGVSEVQNFGYHVPLAEQVKKANIKGLTVATVGAMHNAKLAEQVLQNGGADLIFIGRQFLKDPSLIYGFADELGVQIRWASQYSWMWPWKKIPSQQT